MESKVTRGNGGRVGSRRKEGSRVPFCEEGGTDTGGSNRGRVNLGRMALVSEKRRRHCRAEV